ncbi:MAG: putative Mg2+ transporter-C (MgtC) family protein [Verrucomicrobiota bacterium]
MLEWSEIVIRLGAATLAGGAIGLNRDLHGKPVGLRTLGLVGLATAMVVVSADPAGHAGATFDATSRIIQGILTGIGFLGAGVIIHRESQSRVQGLTSAACTWLTACVGIVCGIGYWRIVILALGIAFMVLLAGGRIERWLHRWLAGKDDAGATSAGPAGSQSSDAGPHQPGR